MAHYAGANHVQVDIDQTALSPKAVPIKVSPRSSMQMLVGLDCGGMIAVFPKCAMPVLALIELLRGLR
jgi:hypothetical protein